MFENTRETVRTIFSMSMMDVFIACIPITILICLTLANPCDFIVTPHDYKYCKKPCIRICIMMIDLLCHVAI